MNKPTVFPDLSQQHTAALAAKAILLDGQKVLFDKKVMLMPTEIKKQKE